MELEYKDFESALGRLEKIVAQLERGELPLEEAMQLFEEGMSISKYCSDRLDEAERKVEILVQNQAGNLEEVPFQEDDSERQTED